MDKFPNIDRMPNIDCPVFIVHGTRDEVVPFYHAEELHKASRHKYAPYYVEGAGHNNVEKFAWDYLARINQFIEHVDAFVARKNAQKIDANNVNYEYHDSSDEEMEIPKKQEDSDTSGTKSALKKDQLTSEGKKRLLLGSQEK